MGKKTRFFGTDKIPLNVMVLGLPGSGKSYFASRLAKRINGDYVNSDRLRKELFPKRTYSNVEKVMVYEAMLKKMLEANSQARNFVLDATFHKKKSRELFIQRLRGKIHFIEVWADEPLVKERLQHDRPYSEADFKIHQLIRDAWEPLEESHLRLQSTNDNIDDMLEKAEAYLKDDKRSS